MTQDFSNFESLCIGDWVEAYDSSFDDSNRKYYYGYVICVNKYNCYLLAPSCVYGFRGNSQSIDYSMFPQYLLNQFIIRNTANIKRKLNFIPYEL